MNATVKVTHLGIDYATIELHISTSMGGKTIEDIEVPLYVGEALDKAGLTNYDYIELDNGAVLEDKHRLLE